MAEKISIQRVMQRWPTQEAAMAHLERVRWQGKPVCPYCGSTRTCVHASRDKKMPRWQCQECHDAFSATVGTIFHHTHLPLSTWFLALVTILNAETPVSSARLARNLTLPYKTAWSLGRRIQAAMKDDPMQAQLFRGIVDVEDAA